MRFLRSWYVRWLSLSSAFFHQKDLVLFGCGWRSLIISQIRLLVVDMSGGNSLQHPIAALTLFELNLFEWVQGQSSVLYQSQVQKWHEAGKLVLQKRRRQLCLSLLLHCYSCSLLSFWDLITFWMCFKLRRYFFQRISLFWAVVEQISTCFKLAVLTPGWRRSHLAIEGMVPPCGSVQAIIVRS